MKTILPFQFFGYHRFMPRGRVREVSGLHSGAWWTRSHLRPRDCVARWYWSMSGRPMPAQPVLCGS
jgi:hypothetical protein